MRAALILVVILFAAGCNAPGGLHKTQGAIADHPSCAVDPANACIGEAGTICASLVVNTGIDARCVPADICDTMACDVGECLFDDDAPQPNVRCICGADVQCSQLAEDDRDAELREKGILE